MNESLVALGRIIADMPHSSGDIEAWRTLNEVRERLENNPEDSLADMTDRIEDFGAYQEDGNDILDLGYEMMGRLYLGVDLKGQKNAVRRTRRLNRNLMKLNQAVFNYLDPDEKEGEIERVEHFTNVAREILEKGE